MSSLSTDSHLYRNSCGPSIAGALTFVVALAFAGRVRPRIDLFLDKCCIHQVDDELKGRGIRAIPEVLRRSDSLLLVYTEDYFRRLWCVLEFALFCDTLCGNQRHRRDALTHWLISTQVAKTKTARWSSCPWGEL